MAMPVRLASFLGFFVTFGEGEPDVARVFEDLDFTLSSQRGVEADRIWRGHTWSA